MSRFIAVMIAVVGLALAPGAGSAFGQLGDGSIGTVQITPPPVDIQIDPAEASFAAATTPASGGPQAADSSVGTAQIGGAGSQTTANSTGTAQIAQPGTQAEGSVQGPLRPDVPDGAVTPEADVAASVDPAESGPQSADGSAGTVQVGGGSQTARNSTGSAQIAVPSVESSVVAGGSPTSPPDG